MIYAHLCACIHMHIVALPLKEENSNVEYSRNNRKGWLIAEVLLHGMDYTCYISYIGSYIWDMIWL